jgi:hypothetical protein
MRNAEGEETKGEGEKKIESVLIFAIPLTRVLKADAGVAPSLGKG